MPEETAPSPADKMPDARGSVHDAVSDADEYPAKRSRPLIMARQASVEVRGVETSVRHPIPVISWAWSVMFGIAVVAGLFTLAYMLMHPAPDVMHLTVQDPEDRPVRDARVTYGDATYRTNDDGEVAFEVLDESAEIRVEADGYTGRSATVTDDHDRDQSVTLEPVNDAAPSGIIIPRYPASASRDVAGVRSMQTTSATRTEVAGRLTDTNGKPIVSAWVTDGETFTFSDRDGLFAFAPGNVSPESRLTISAPGFRVRTIDLKETGPEVDIKLTPQEIRGIYFNPTLSNNPDAIANYIDIAQTTSVNAVVIDIKEEVIYYDTTVEFFRDAGVVYPIMDITNVLQRFHDAGIYTIARQVVFKDSYIAEAYPEYAIRDAYTGGVWRDNNGSAWVDPTNHRLWDANLDLAEEASRLGFDEIQLDYIRFPTDGDLSRVQYSQPIEETTRENTIESFVERCHRRLIPTGTRLSADIFGYTLIVEDDLGIGQNMDQLADELDYLSPMIYPSHWPLWSIDTPGHPNDYPYETVNISMSAGIDQLDGNSLKFRPWLQDFTHPGMRAYGEWDVRAQIQAAEELGLSGWLIWSPTNWFHIGAFGSAEAPVKAPITPIPVNATESSSRSQHLRR